MDALIIEHYGQKVGTLINGDAQTAMADSAERLQNQRTIFQTHSTTYVPIFFLPQKDTKLPGVPANRLYKAFQGNGNSELISSVVYYQLRYNSLVRVESLDHEGAPFVMTISRGKYGKITPFMSKTGPDAFWRIRKVRNGSDALEITEGELIELEDTMEGEEIERGDTISLRWQFSDQKSGVSDYLDNSLGSTWTISALETIELSLHAHRSNGGYLSNPLTFDVGISPPPRILKFLGSNNARVDLAAMYGILASPELQFRLDSVDESETNRTAIDPMSRTLQYMASRLISGHI
ncbi:hypothetical protein Q9L58_009359 [Maublancomyces gigas]|uniref:Uncharacterized protein n=1 Tax=Discina gigas TaxID=1032678 RepID=A0ABR3G739_9PEZI